MIIEYFSTSINGLAKYRLRLIKGPSHAAKLCALPGKQKRDLGGTTVAAHFAGMHAFCGAAVDKSSELLLHFGRIRSRDSQPMVKMGAAGIGRMG